MEVSFPFFLLVNLPSVDLMCSFYTAHCALVNVRGNCTAASYDPYSIGSQFIYSASMMHLLVVVHDKYRRHMTCLWYNGRMLDM